MYPPGHVGIALALYAPVGAHLLVRGRSRLAVAGTFLVSGVTLLPDVDQWLPGVAHRGLTHSVWFAVAVGVSLGALAAIWGGYRHREVTAALAVGAFGVFVGTLAVLAHLLGDVVTPMGIRPFHPLIDTRYTFDLVLASDATANARLFAFGSLATAAQMLLGAGLVPTGSRRSTLREAVVAVVTYVRYGWRDAPAGHR